MQDRLILNNVKPNVHGIGEGETMHRKYTGLNLGGRQAYEPSAN
jgi:hypothetical protein